MSIRPASTSAISRRKRRTLHGPTGLAAIVVAGGKRPPALAALACHIGLAGRPLRLETVEGLVEPVFRALAGVDRATQMRLGHRGAPPLPATGAQRSAGRSSVCRQWQLPPPRGSGRAGSPAEPFGRDHDLDHAPLPFPAQAGASPQFLSLGLDPAAPGELTAYLPIEAPLRLGLQPPGRASGEAAPRRAAAAGRPTAPARGRKPGEVERGQRGQRLGETGVATTGAGRRDRTGERAAARPVTSSAAP